MSATRNRRSPPAVRVNGIFGGVASVQRRTVSTLTPRSRAAVPMGTRCAGSMGRERTHTYVYLASDTPRSVRNSWPLLQDVPRYA